jgi:O-antigen/teichoic acid export membrane protein
MSSDTERASGLTSRGRLALLLRDSALYGSAAALSRAFSLITFPILARHFSVAEYGVLDYFLTIASLLAAVLIFGQDSAVARFFYEHTDRDERKQLISQSLLFQIAGVALVAPILWLLADRIAVALLPFEQAIRAPELLRLVVLQFPFLLLINFSQNLLKWTFDRVRFLTMSLGMTVFQASGLLIAVLVFDAGVREVLIVCLTTSAVFGTLGLLFVRKWLIWPRGFSYLREILPFAVPLGVICVAGAFAPTLERTLTERLLGTTDLGLYAAGTKVAMLVGLVIGAFQTAWGPFALSIYRQPDAAHFYNQVLRLFALGICVFVLGLSLLGGLIILVLSSDRYSGASVVVFPLAMGLAVQATGWITELGIGLSKRSHLNLYPYLVSLAAAFCAIWLLAPVLGLLGVGLGVLIGHLVKAIVASWLAQRAYPVPWSYAPVVVLMMTTIVVGVVAALLGLRYGGPVQAVTIAVSLPFFTLAGWRLLFKARERRAIRELVVSRLTEFVARFRRR